MRFRDISPRQQLDEANLLVKGGQALLAWLAKLAKNTKNGAQFVDDAVRAADESDDVLLNYLIKQKVINKGDKVDDLSELKRLLDTVKREKITTSPGDEMNHAARLYQVNQRLKAAERVRKQADNAVTSGTKKTGPNITRQRVNKELDDFAKKNNIADPNKIQIGQEITLPNGSVYTVQSGDTLGGILQKFKNSQSMGKSANREREEMDKLFGGDWMDQFLADEKARKILSQYEVENPGLLKRVWNFLKKDAGQDAGKAWRDTKRGLKTFGALGLLLFLKQCEDEQGRTGEESLSTDQLDEIAGRVNGFLTSKTEEEIKDLQSDVAENPETFDTLVYPTLIRSVEDYRKFMGVDPPEDSPLWDQEQSQTDDGTQNTNDTEGDGREADIGTDANAKPGSDTVTSTDNQGPERSDLPSPERRKQELPTKPEPGRANINPDTEEPDIDAAEVEPIEADSQAQIDARNKQREEEKAAAEEKRRAEEAKREAELKKAEEERIAKEKADELRRQKEEERKRQEAQEIERLRRELEAEKERQRQAEAERQRQKEEERKRQEAEAEAERKEAERKRQEAAAAEAERRRQEAEAERKRQEAEAERKRQEAEAEAERKRQTQQDDQGGNGSVSVPGQGQFDGSGTDGGGGTDSSGTDSSGIDSSGIDSSGGNGSSGDGSGSNGRKKVFRRRGGPPPLRQSLPGIGSSTIYGYDDRVDEQTGYTKQQYANLARKYATMYDVPLPLVLHVLNRETGHVDADTAASILGPKLKSGQRAVGVMQLNPGPEDIYLKDFGISRKDLTNPEKNIQAGVRLLAKHYNTYNQNPQYALMAYNWGPTATNKWIDKGANLARLKKYNPETYEYVYGSKEKGWSSYEGDLNLQAQAYLGDDGAKTFLPNVSTTPVANKEPMTQNDGSQSIWNKNGGIALDRVGSYLYDKYQQFKQGITNTDPADIDQTKSAIDYANKNDPGRQGILRVPTKVAGAIANAPGALKSAADATVDAVAPPKGMEDYGLDSSGKTKWDREIENDPSMDPKLGKVKEEAPPGKKYERMVKHVKKGYAKDGKLTKREKGIAYATAWKLYNQSKKKKS